jgi:Haem-binding uptake, Tiki superfamily, ChaN
MGTVTGMRQDPTLWPGRRAAEPRGVDPAVLVAVAPPGSAAWDTFPFRLRDGHTGEALPPASLRVRLQAARVVYAGERHDRAPDHDVQLALLVQLHALSPGAGSVGVGLEMLPRARQSALDDHLAGRTEEAEFLRAVDWDHTWGFDFSFYRPIFAFCREHRLPMLALNAPRELVRALRQQGVAGLTDAQRAVVAPGARGRRSCGPPRRARPRATPRGRVVLDGAAHPPRRAARGRRRGRPPR